MISVSDGEQTWSGHPKNFNWDALDGATLVSHNKQFDATVYNRLVELGKAPQLNISEWHDSANMSAFLCNRRSLKDAASFLLGVELSKDTRDYANGKHWEDMVSEGKSEEMLAYARSDALHCHRLFTRYGHLWPERERALSELTIQQGMRGIQINEELLKEYIVIATQMLAATEAILPWIKEGRPPTSPKAICEKCREVGIPCPPVKSHFDDGEARFNEWEAAYGGTHKWIANVASWRSINKFLESLHTIAERLQPDGIFTFGLKYFGAHTGRWSGDSGFNMQNLRKVPLFRDEGGLLISDSARLKEIASSRILPGNVTAVLDIRKLFIPRRGKKMIVSDLSQIEPRVLAWLVQDTEMLDKMRAGQSPYQAHAEATMGWIRGDMKALIKAGQLDVQEIYALAKARVLGLGYGCGWKKFITVAQVMAQIDITINDPEFIQAVNDEGQPCFDENGPIMVSGYGLNSQRIVKEYRSQNPKITALWKTLDTAFKDSTGGNFEMQLPSGRSMRYGEVRRECRTTKDEDTGALKRKWITTANIGGRRFPLYGGLLVENLVQATSRDVFGEHLLNLQNTSGIDTLFSSHDEAIIETDEGVNARDVEQIMSKTPEWIQGLPVAAEAKEVNHYVK
jgi:DNA polymerase